MNTRVADSINAGALADGPGGRWLDPTDPTVVDAARGVFVFPALGLIDTVVKVYELPSSAKAQYVQVGLQHPHGAVGFSYKLVVLEADDLPLAPAVALDDYTGAATAPLPFPVLTIAQAPGGAEAPVFRTKRRFLVFAVTKTTLSPDCEVVVSVLSWSENNEIPRLTPTV